LKARLPWLQPADADVVRIVANYKVTPQP